MCNILAMLDKVPYLIQSDILFKVIYLQSVMRKETNKVIYVFLLSLRSETCFWKNHYIPINYAKKNMRPIITEHIYRARYQCQYQLRTSFRINNSIFFMKMLHKNNGIIDTERIVFMLYMFGNNWSKYAYVELLLSNIYSIKITIFVLRSVSIIPLFLFYFQTFLIAIKRVCIWTV